ncbi:MAG: hypothetical protein ACRDQ1_12090, partial [Sciscionella sp.]
MLFAGPDTRVFELRTHGIMGTTPEAMVDAAEAVDVAGDGVGRFVRPADRLRRPAPGPVLQIAGRSTPRVVEGYLWSRMTSGGAAKAIWALLFPFSLANMSYWMLPPVPQGNRLASSLGVLLRSLLRLAALLLTVLLLSQLATFSLDLLAAQCLSPHHPRCLSQVSLDVRTLPWLRALLGTVPIAIAVLVLHQVSTVEWKARERLRAPGAPTHRLPKLPAGNLRADPDTPA